MSEIKSTIDESLYSRQLGAIGFDAMKKMIKSSVLISCAGTFSGVALELAKCVILSGIGKVGINASIDMLTYKDLASNYYVDENDVGKPFLNKVVDNLSSLNKNVQVVVEMSKRESKSLDKSSDEFLDESLDESLLRSKIKQYDCVVFCDYNVHDLIFWNNCCRENDVKFIMLNTHGLVGELFCDFGPNHTIYDLDGEVLKSGPIAKIESGRFYTPEPHRLFTGNLVTIEKNDTADMINFGQYVVKVVSPTSFLIVPLTEQMKTMTSVQLQIMIRNVDNYCISEHDHMPQNIIFKQFKLPTIMKFQSLEESLKSPEFVMFDTMNWDMPRILHSFMIALSTWRIENPFIYDRATYLDDVWESYPIYKKDWEKLKKYFFLDLTLSKSENKIQWSNVIDTIFYQLAMTCGGRICGVDAVIGAMGAQEVIKAVSEKFTPTKQFLHFDALSILPDTYVRTRDCTINGSQFKPIKNRYDGQRIIFGSNYVELMKKRSVFVVGAGAIGCEHLKNMCMMGLGKITITDMDHIENSNLNRQFLFRREDIGQPKSITAIKKAKSINPDVELIGHENKVCKETSGVYNWAFFQNIDMVANALDNAEARLYVDGLCVKYDKPLLESGTLGTKGSIQTIIPHLSESYGSIQDPPEQSIAVCTLKLFPYKFEHTVQYSRDIFEGYFNRIPQNLIKVLNDPGNFLEQLTPTNLSIMYEDVKTLTDNCKNFKHCINFAYKQWHCLFRDPINQLIRKYPSDYRDDEGMYFWSGSKIFPRSFNFDKTNETDMDFIIAFSQVWADVLAIPHNKRYGRLQREKYVKFIDRLKPPTEIEINETDNKDRSNETNDMITKIKTMIHSHQNLNEIRPIEFEKDDDTNNHVDFITACSNKRAANYNIETKDRLTTKSIAGKIIPAISTTTSIVSGLVSLEMYKVMYSQMVNCDPTYKTLDRFKYGSFNLATQSFGFGELNPPPRFSINGEQHSLWTKTDIPADKLLGDVLDEWSDIRVQVKGNKSSMMTVDFVHSEHGIIYSNMTNQYDDESILIKNRSMREIIQSVSANRDKQLKGDYYFTLSLEENDSEDESMDDNEKQKNQNNDVMVTLRVSIMNE
jgi:ubiquitin-activating enzyme E1